MFNTGITYVSEEEAGRIAKDRDPLIEEEFDMTNLSRRQFIAATARAATAVTCGLLLPGLGVALHGQRHWWNQPEVDLTLGYLPVTHHLIGCVFCARAHEEPERQPVRIRLLKFGNWAEVAEALRSDRLELTYLITPMAIKLRAAGVPVKILAAGHRNGSIITVGKGTAVQSLAHLNGMRVAVPALFSTHNLLLRYGLRKAGLGEKAFTPHLLSPPEMVPALAAGQVDAFFGPEPYSAIAEMHGIGVPAILSRSIYPEHMDCALVGHERLLDRNPEAVQRFVEAFVDTGRWAEAHRLEAADLVAGMLGQRRETMRYALTRLPDHIRFDRVEPDTAFLELMQDEMLRAGFLDSPIAIEQLVEASFVQRALARGGAKDYRYA